MKTLAIIPARGGSKSIPKKNIVDLMGRPLVAWTIQQALDSNVVDYVHVSTDDEKISETAIKFGAHSDFLRPKDISGDVIGTREAILHSIATLEALGHSFDLVLELQPTYCFRGKDVITEIVNIFRSDHKQKVDSVITCTKVEDTSHPDYILSTQDDGYVKFGLKDIDTFARQKLSPKLACKGIVLASRVKSYIKSHSFFSGQCLPYLIKDKLRTTDINDSFDLDIARALAEKYSYL